MESTKKELPIDITEASEVFRRHLDLPENNRIIFSGAFGTGKTYFLDKYFKKENHVIHLFPVKYSVSSNEDIFELIKYDLLFELLNKDIELEKVEFNKLLVLPFFLKEKTTDILRLLLEESTQIGKDIAPIGDKLLKLNDEFLKYRDDVQIDEHATIVQYLQTVKNKTGHAFEEDVFTQLIGRLVEQLKKDKQQATLIIDDLDRIDPEHIFRLLNVFAAHFDVRGTGNKFDFDKVIFVCDIENIRNIFHAKYGADTDFSGYIDKFYSTEIFIFDNSQIVENTIEQILLSITIDKNKEKFAINKRDHGIHRHLTYILSIMVKCNAVNLRSLIKLAHCNYIIKEKLVVLQQNRYVQPNFSFYGVLIIDFLMFVLGDVDRLKKALEKCASSKYGHGSKDEDPRELLKYIIPVLDLESTFTGPHYGSRTYIANVSTLTYQVGYELKGGLDTATPYFANISGVHLNSQLLVGGGQMNFFRFMLLVVKTLQSYKYLPQ